MHSHEAHECGAELTLIELFSLTLCVYTYVYYSEYGRAKQDSLSSIIMLLLIGKRRRQYVTRKS